MKHGSSRLSVVLVIVLGLIVFGGWAWGLSSWPPAQESDQASPAAATPSSTPTDGQAEQPVATARRLAVKRPAGTMRVLFTGDSLTGSYFATTEAQGFRPLLVAGLGDIEAVGVGVPHGRLSEVEAGTAIPSGATLAVIEVGTNDFGKTPLGGFRQQYDSLLDRVAAKSPGVRFLCMGIWRTANATVANIPGAGYDAEIKESCEERRGHYLPLQPIYDAPGSRGPAGVDTFAGKSDVFHPNNEGHAAIAEAALSSLVLR